MNETTVKETTCTMKETAVNKTAANAIVASSSRVLPLVQALRNST